MLVINAIQQKFVVISPLDRELQFIALKASCALMKKKRSMKTCNFHTSGWKSGAWEQFTTCTPSHLNKCGNPKMERV